MGNEQGKPKEKDDKKGRKNASSIDPPAQRPPSIIPEAINTGEVLKKSQNEQTTKRM
jgi:hypothetical protein